jgi:hypothetical protein
MGRPRRTAGRAQLEGVSPKSPAQLKLGRAVPSAPWENAKTRTFRTSSDARGALGTARPTADLFGQDTLDTRRSGPVQTVIGTAISRGLRR